MQRSFERLRLHDVNSVQPGVLICKMCVGNSKNIWPKLTQLLNFFFYCQIYWCSHRLALENLTKKKKGKQGTNKSLSRSAQLNKHN